MEALKGGDALVIVTEWPESRSTDFSAIKAALKQPLILDGATVMTRMPCADTVSGILIQ